MTVAFTQEQLEDFTGTVDYYKSTSLVEGIVHTDGVQHIVTHGGAWMVDLIVSHQANKRFGAKSFRFGSFTSTKTIAPWQLAQTANPITCWPVNKSPGLTCPSM